MGPYLTNLFWIVIISFLLPLPISCRSDENFNGNLGGIDGANTICNAHAIIQI